MKWWVWVLFAIAGTLVWFVIIQLLVMFGIAANNDAARFDLTDAYIMGTFVICVTCIVVPVFRYLARHKD